MHLLKEKEKWFILTFAICISLDDFFLCISVTPSLQRGVGGDSKSPSPPLQKGELEGGFTKGGIREGI